MTDTREYCVLMWKILLINILSDTISYAVYGIIRVKYFVICSCSLSQHDFTMISLPKSVFTVRYRTVLGVFLFVIVRFGPVHYGSTYGIPGVIFCHKPSQTLLKYIFCFQIRSH